PMYDLFAWLSLTAAVPLMLLSLVSNGPASTWHELTHASAKAIISILFIGCVTTSIAYWLWGRLLRDHPAAQVVPFALLVPFVGSGASRSVFAEKFGTLRLAGMLTVIAGIAVMLLSRRPRALPKTAGA